MDDPRKQAAIDWLCTPKDDRWPRTQKELDESLGNAVGTVARWKRDKDFVDAWDLQYKRGVASPEKVGAILAALERTALDADDPRQVPAARAYLDAIGAIKPQKVDVTVNKGQAKDLSDDELIAAMAEHAAREFEKRQGTVIDAAPPQVVDYVQQTGDTEE